tara:strand:+ start:7073 stop:7855 length:783 start_codon:yes stop_codon:yes gene_type:complete
MTENNNQNSTENPTSAENAQVETTQNESTTSWIDKIQDNELKNSKSLSNFKDVDALAKSYVNLEKKLGQPKEPEKYEVDQYNYEFGDDYKPHEGIYKNFTDKAIELGVNPDAFKELISTYVDSEQQAINDFNKEQETLNEEFTSKLKEDWGNDYSKNLEKAENLWTKFAPENADKMFSKMTPEMKGAVAKAMFNISKTMSDSHVEAPNRQQDLTKEEIQNKIDEIRNDKSHPYFNASHKDHKEANKHMTNLYLEKAKLND